MDDIPILLINPKERTLSVSLKGYLALIDSLPRAERARIGALVDEIAWASLTHTPILKKRRTFHVPQPSSFLYRQQSNAKSKERN